MRIVLFKFIRDFMFEIVNWVGIFRNEEIFEGFQGEKGKKNIVVMFGNWLMFKSNQ